VTHGLPDREHLHALCVKIDSRRVGSAGNLAATRYAAEVLRSFGFRVETPTFACIDWTDHGANVSAGGEGFDASPSPYSLGCRVEAPLVCATTLRELQAADAGGRILLLQGELAREPLMPKNFPFYNLDEHRHLIRTLETYGRRSSFPPPPGIRRWSARSTPTRCSRTATSTCRRFS
jgi:aminopeptidase YwaD